MAGFPLSAADCTDVEAPAATPRFGGQKSDSKYSIGAPASADRVLAVAAYNAGETKIAQWVRQRGHLPVDHFVETIPFRETRYYVKRVLGSAFAYNVLRGVKQPVFDVPRVFSAKLVVKSRHWQRSVNRWTKARRKAQRKKRKRQRKASRARRRRKPSRACRR